MSDQRLIEAAPTDGTRILAYGFHAFENTESWATVAWCKYSKGFICDPSENTEYDPAVSKISYWMLLPEPPK